MTREEWEQILFEHVSDEVVQDMLNGYVLELEAESERLRDALDFERSENGLAREFLNRMAEHCGTKDCPSLVAYVERIEGENAKLRELCATVIDDWMRTVCPSFPFCEFGGEYQLCTDEACGNQTYRQTARELGIEVEE